MEGGPVPPGPAEGGATRGPNEQVQERGGNETVQTRQYGTGMTSPHPQFKLYSMEQYNPQLSRYANATENNYKYMSNYQYT